MNANLQVGPQTVSDGALPILRGGKSGEAIFQELHGRFYEQNYRGAIFHAGMTLTSISNATFTTATTDATATPIIGLWNPQTNNVNLVVLQASIGVIQTALQATGCGGFVWVACTGNAAISTGIVPWNGKTLVQSGSSAKAFAGTALTAKTNALSFLRGSSLGGGAAYNASLLGTAAGFMTQMIPSVENIDGSIIVPPGGVLALQCITTPVAHSAVSGIVWEEVAI